MKKLILKALKFTALKKIKNINKKKRLNPKSYFNIYRATRRIKKRNKELSEKNIWYLIFFLLL